MTEPTFGGSDDLKRAIDNILGHEEVHVQLEQFGAALGLPPGMIQQARDIHDNGIDCDRCGENQKGPVAINGVMVMVAYSPLMPTPSPGTVLCHECAYRTAAFMGIEAAKEVVERKYGG